MSMDSGIHFFLFSYISHAKTSQFYIFCTKNFSYHCVYFHICYLLVIVHHLFFSLYFMHNEFSGFFSHLFPQINTDIHIYTQTDKQISTWLVLLSGTWCTWLVLLSGTWLELMGQRKWVLRQLVEEMMLEVA